MHNTTMDGHKMLKHMNSSIIGLLMIANCCHTIEQRHYGKYEYGACPSEEDKFKEFIKISIRDCVTNCALRPLCNVAGYKRRLKTCSLHYRTPEEFAVNGNPECVQIKMDTVDVAKVLGDCKCKQWMSCGEPTDPCVLKDLTNIALQKPTKQSSTKSAAVSSLGVDGNTNQNYFHGNSCFHTRVENNPWWRVDLEAINYIQYARLYNRLDTDLLARRAHDISIEVGNTLGTMKKVATISGVMADIEEVQMPVGTYARYFKITIMSKDAASVDLLHLCEVEIFGYTDQE